VANATINGVAATLKTSENKMKNFQNIMKAREKNKV
jgi:hypothetical protein